MKDTKATTVIAIVVLGAVIGALMEALLAARGMPIVLPPVTLPVALVLIALLVVLMALPIRRMTKGAETPPVDPFYATRVVMLAKASALSGSLVVGFAVGVLTYLLSRSVIGVGSVAQTVGTIVGAGVLLVAGLIAEQMCKIPPGDEDDPGKKPVHAQP